MITQHYKTCTKRTVATAYGYLNVTAFMQRLKKAADKKANKEHLPALGEYTTKEPLLPAQVAAIVHILGAPENRLLLCTEEKS